MAVNYSNGQTPSRTRARSRWRALAVVTPGASALAAAEASLLQHTARVNAMREGRPALQKYSSWACSGCHATASTCSLSLAWNVKDCLRYLVREGGKRRRRRIRAVRAHSVVAADKPSPPAPPVVVAAGPQLQVRLLWPAVVLQRERLGDDGLCRAREKGRGMSCTPATPARGAARRPSGRRTRMLESQFQLSCLTWASPCAKGSVNSPWRRPLRSKKTTSWRCGRRCVLAMRLPEGRQHSADSRPATWRGGWESNAGVWGKAEKKGTWRRAVYGRLHTAGGQAPARPQRFYLFACGVQ